MKSSRDTENIADESEALVPKAIETITASGQTGKIGDGKIWVYSLDELVRIRTGETDVSAL